MDLLPTILEATGTPMQADIGGQPVQTPDGESLLGALQGRAWSRDQPIHWEHEGNCAIRQGSLKLVRQHGQPWELYDMERDRTELHDLAARHPDTCRQMARAFDDHASRVGVADWQGLQPALLRAWEMSTPSG